MPITLNSARSFDTSSGTRSSQGVALSWMYCPKPPRRYGASVQSVVPYDRVFWHDSPTAHRKQRPHGASRKMTRSPGRSGCPSTSVDISGAISAMTPTFSWPKIIGAGVASRRHACTSVPQMAAICICRSAPPGSIGSTGNSCTSRGLFAPTKTAALHVVIRVIPPSVPAVPSTRASRVSPLPAGTGARSPTRGGRG